MATATKTKTSQGTPAKALDPMIAAMCEACPVKGKFDEVSQKFIESALKICLDKAGVNTETYGISFYDGTRDAEPEACAHVCFPKSFEYDKGWHWDCSVTFYIYHSKMTVWTTVDGSQTEKSVELTNFDGLPELIHELFVTTALGTLKKRIAWAENCVRFIEKNEAKGK